MHPVHDLRSKCLRVVQRIESHLVHREVDLCFDPFVQAVRC